MARYVARVHSPWSVTDAFSLMADMRTFADWDPGIRSVTQVEGDGAGLGAAYDVRFVGFPLDLTLRYQTEEYRCPASRSEPHEVLLVSRGLLLAAVDRITVTAAPGGCEIVYDADLRLRGPLRWGDLALRPAFGWIARRADSGLHAATRAAAAAA
jgi:hypothetical protein